MEIVNGELYYAMAAGAFLVPEFVCSSLAKRIYKSVVEDKVVAACKRTFLGDQDLVDMQKALFRMHTNKFVPLLGRNTWRSDDGKVFTSLDGNVHLPPYIDRGVCDLARKYVVDQEWTIQQSEDSLADISKDTVCAFGGSCINRFVANHMSTLQNLRFRFEKLSNEEYPRLSPREFTRHYLDDNGTMYKKQSRTGLYLVDAGDDKAPPIGPFVSEDGKIERDVLLVTVVKLPTGGRLVWVTSGYGGACRFPDVVCDPGILSVLYSKAIEKKSEPWFQAVFQMKVEHGPNSEHYGQPELFAYGNPYRF